MRNLGVLKIKIQMLARDFLPADFEKRLVGYVELCVLARRNQDGTAPVGDVQNVELCKKVVENGVRKIAV